MQVHYLLGYETKEFVLTKGQDLEIKIHYGPKYEKIRVKNGYSRVQGAELAKLQKEIQRDDADFLRQCGRASLAVVDKNVAFLETFAEELGRRQLEAADNARQRALLVAILSVVRIDNLAHRLAEHDSSPIKVRATAVLRRLATIARHYDKKDLFANATFRPVLWKHLQVSSVDKFLDRLEGMCARD